MESKIETTSVYTIVLNDEEAEYLRDLIQNGPTNFGEATDKFKIRIDLQNAVRKVSPTEIP